MTLKLLDALVSIYELLEDWWHITQVLKKYGDISLLQREYWLVQVIPQYENFISK